MQPIIGCDLWLTNERSRDPPYRVAVLCRNRAGYLALCELLTRAHVENHWRGRAEVRREWLKGVAGLIVLSGAQAGDVGQALAGRQRGAGRGARPRAWAADFPGAFYLELQRVDPDRDEPHVRAAVALAGRLALPVVATHPVQFVKREDYRAHEARVCIAQGYVLGDQRRPREFRPSQYFKTQEEMARLFADLPGGARELGGDRAPLQLRVRRSARAGCRISRRPTARRSRTTCGCAPGRGSTRAWPSSIPRARRARGAAAAIRASASSSS